MGEQEKRTSGNKKTKIILLIIFFGVAGASIGFFESKVTEGQIDTERSAKYKKIPESDGYKNHTLVREES